jgi:hypothetical protein
MTTRGDQAKVASDKVTRGAARLPHPGPLLGRARTAHSRGRVPMPRGLFGGNPTGAGIRWYPARPCRRLVARRSRIWSAREMTEISTPRYRTWMCPAQASSNDIPGRKVRRSTSRPSVAVTSPWPRISSKRSVSGFSPWALRASKARRTFPYSGSRAKSMSTVVRGTP